jgi:PRTRC genetic system protein C
MPATIKPLKRIFKYNGLDLPDPDPVLSPEAVGAHYAGAYPELHNIESVSSHYEKDSQVFEFKRGYGAKG